MTAPEGFELVPHRIAVLGRQIAAMLDGAQERAETPAVPDDIGRLTALRNELAAKVLSTCLPCLPCVQGRHGSCHCYVRTDSRLVPCACCGPSPDATVCKPCGGAGEQRECLNDGSAGCSHINDREWPCQSCGGTGVR